MRLAWRAGYGKKNGEGQEFGQRGNGEDADVFTHVDMDCACLLCMHAHAHPHVCVFGACVCVCMCVFFARPILWLQSSATFFVADCEKLAPPELYTVPGDWTLAEVCNKR